ncbi:DesA family fatty acid desaturase [Thioalkalivibrio sp. HK1]|uniref:DesA family fatty acid desaturase n=1 Tax=Thioalkalivibrio sp. HK1 TaxID=1469245 RepID=UPI00046EA38A|nr:fatty acid desaturase [Thioalkalivibrio sp. HK1]
MFSGLLDLPWWGNVLAALALTHLTIISVTIYLHRHQAHRAVDIHPALAHFFRFWLWLTTGTVTSEWVAVHRKHHAKVESADDPHSPKIHGIRCLLLHGAELYRIGAADAETVSKYGHGCPDDWLERNLYKPWTNRGYYLMLLIDIILFGPIGITIWAVQMAWIPIFAAGVINGLGHWWGYRNYETCDTSSNIVPWGILIGGEELHNNHHAFAGSAKLSSKWWEFDIGWLYIRILEGLRLARVRRLPPEVVMVPGKKDVDVETMRAVVSNRFQVMADYACKVLHRVHAEEVEKLESVDSRQRGFLKSARSLLIREDSLLSLEAKQHLEQVLARSDALNIVYRYKCRLQAIWRQRHANHEHLVSGLREWCRQAEESGVRALEEFARSLPEYAVPPSKAVNP